ncbi:hypothetical protein VRK_12880 [Vibrio sp. MEBiC08052]|nr:hypothetical protein VRK_12880 [Vibrio sp. MEBiC08052]
MKSYVMSFLLLSYKSEVRLFTVRKESLGFMVEEISVSLPFVTGLITGNINAYHSMEGVF